MKAIGILLVLMAVACTWLVADGDRARLERWTAQWTAGTIEHSDDLHRRIATLEDNLAYQMEAGRREEREASELRLELADMATERDAALARGPGVIVVHIPVLAHHHHAHRKHRHHRHHHRVHCRSGHSRRSVYPNATAA